MRQRVCKLIRQGLPVLADAGLLSASGASVPSAVSGYQPGCLFQDTTNGKLYVNEGTLASCTFAVIEALTAAQEALLGATAGVVTASKAVIVDSNKDVGDYRNLDCVNLDAGSSGAAGSVDVFPATAEKGKLAVSCTNQAGDTTVSVVVAEMAAARVINLPDPGKTSYLMQSSAQVTCAEADVLDGATVGTQVAGKAVIANADVNTGVSKVTELHIGTTGSETQVTASAAELNVCDITAAGTVEASKAVVVDASKDISSFNDVGMGGTLTITGATGRAIDVATSGVTRMGVQGTGIPVSTAYPLGLEAHSKATTDVSGGDPGIAGGIYSRYEIGFDQTIQCSHVAVTGKLRVKKDLAGGSHAGVLGYVEISEVGTVIGGTASTTTAAGHFAVEADANFELTTGHLNGVCVDSSVHSSATITGTMAGIRVKKSSGKKAWPTGIKVEDDAAEVGVHVGVCTTGIQNAIGAAAAAVAMRFGKTVTEGLEVKVIDEIVTLTNTVETDLTETVPDGAVILSVQANNDTLVVGDASGDNGLTKVGIGITGDPDKYGLSADLVLNTKTDTLPAYAVLSGAETVTVKAADDAGAAVTEKFVAGGKVRVRIVYLACNSLDDAA